MWQWIIVGMATGAGTGWLPRAPGTWGTLVGLALAWVLAPLSGVAAWATLVALVALAVWSAGVAAAMWGRKDPREIVIDEIAGIYLVMFAQPWTWATVLAGFAAFRLFDVWKPAPARWAEFLPGGWGIVADDLIAAGYAWLVVYVVGRLAGA